MSAQNIFVHPEQELNFGEFVLTSGQSGVISISESGSWSTSGNVQMLGSTPKMATFLISTDSTVPLEIHVEAYATNLINTKDQQELRIEPVYDGDRVYTIQLGNPVRISVGGILTINSVGEVAQGKYLGNVSIRVIEYND